MKLKIKSKIQCERSKRGECNNTGCNYYYTFEGEESLKSVECRISGEVQKLTCTEITPGRALTFLERFKENHKRDTIWCTLWDKYRTFTEFYSQVVEIFGSRGMSFPVGLIYDGYWLVLLSPLVLTYWILFIPILLLLSFFWLLLWPIFIPIGIWTVLFELPASILNKKEVELWGKGGGN